MVRTAGALAADVQFHAAEAKSRREYRGRGRRTVQAKDAAAAGAAEMQVPAMLAVRIGGRKAENPSPIGSLAGQADIDQPLENPVEGHSIRGRKCIVVQLLLDVAMAERRMGCPEQSENSNPGGGDPSPGRTDGGLDSGESEIGMGLHANI